jgi:hypothetical protein
MSEVQPAPAKSEKEIKADKRKAAAELKAKKKADKKAAAEAKTRADKAAKEAKAPETINTPQTNAAPSIVKESVMRPIVSPPMPISTDKQAQLQALLAKYKADLITAGQYQTERTKILAEP